MEKTYYTLEQAEKIIRRRDGMKKRNRQKKIAYYFKQKLYGLLLVIVSIISIIALHDATVSILFIPVGIYLLITKKQLIWTK